MISDELTATSGLYKFDRLVEQYRANKDNISNKPTIYEIAGFPSRENVFSNVLKFFLDSRQCHEFGTHILKALLDAAGFHVNEGLNVLEVRREVYTESGGFIDLVIRTEKYIIAIENKVFHHLNNDLEDYSRTVRNKWPKKDDEKYINLILSLKFQQGENSTWKVVTYAELVKQLSSIKVLFDTSKVYHLYFLDFIKNINNHLIPGNMTKEQIDFLANNEEIVEDLTNLHKLSADFIFNRRNKVFQALILPNVEWGNKVWDYQMFLNRNFSGSSIRLIGSLEISSIYIEIEHNSIYYDELLEFLLNIGYSVAKKTNVGSLIREFFPIYNVTDEEISNYINLLLIDIEKFIVRKSN